MCLYDEAILAGHSMAFHHIWELMRESRYLRQVSGHWADPNEDGDSVAKCPRIDYRAIPDYDTILLKALDALAHRWRRHSDAAREFGGSDSRLRNQHPQDRDIHGIAKRFCSLNGHSYTSLQIDIEVKPPAFEL